MEFLAIHIKLLQVGRRQHSVYKPENKVDVCRNVGPRYRKRETRGHTKLIDSEFQGTSVQRGCLHRIFPEKSQRWLTLGDEFRERIWGDYHVFAQQGPARVNGLTEDGLDNYCMRIN